MTDASVSAVLKPLLVLFVLGGCLMPAVTLAAGEREQELAEQLLAADPPGEPIWLAAAADRFLALHDAALGALPRRAVLLVHDMGGHPDWPEVIAPLRTGLPDHGWSTLSLQMPLLSLRAQVSDYGGTVIAAGQRIASGIDYLQKQGYSRIVLLGYGFGASQALAWLANESQADAPVDGLILVGVLAREFLQPPLDPAELLAKVRVPVLDLYARSGFPAVEDRALLRQQAVPADTDYTRQAIAGTDHYFTGVEDRLLQVIVAWLENHAQPAYAILDADSAD